MITEQDIKDIVDAVANDVDEWIRKDGGTYDELEAVIEAAVKRIAWRQNDH